MIECHRGLLRAEPLLSTPYTATSPPPSHTEQGTRVLPVCQVEGTGTDGSSGSFLVGQRHLVAAR